MPKKIAMKSSKPELYDWSTTTKTSHDLVNAVREVAAGTSLIDPELTARVLERVRNPSPVNPKLASVTDQERKLLSHVAEGLTNRQIGEQMFLAEKTVRNYVSSIVSKLGLARRTQGAVLASKLLDTGLNSRR